MPTSTSQSSPPSQSSQSPSQRPLRRSRLRRFGLPVLLLSLLLGAGVFGLKLLEESAVKRSQQDTITQPVKRKAISITITANGTDLSYPVARNIGVRKALSATNSAVLSQFLTESVVISVMGGGIGIVLGIGITFIAASLFKFPFIVSISAVVTGFVLSTSVGLIAGVIPARNAAKLDPIAALRSE